jgi:hypothetical protein
LAGGLGVGGAVVAMGDGEEFGARPIASDADGAPTGSLWAIVDGVGEQCR